MSNEPGPKGLFGRLLDLLRPKPSEIPPPIAPAPPVVRHPSPSLPPSTPTTKSGLPSKSAAQHVTRGPLIGRETQFSGRELTDTQSLVVGLDFGTSATKVVIRSPFAHGQRAIAVPFADLTGDGSAFLLPTRMFASSSGVVSLQPTAGARCVSSIKVRLLDAKPNGAQDGAVDAVAFLALVLQRTRKWFLETQGEIYGRSRLEWSLNVGIPSAGYDDDDVRSAFRRVATAAWTLSTHSGAVTLDSAARALSAAGDSPDADLSELEVVPEVAAEVVGYARSKLRRLGLYVLVDVGALTLDVSSFTLHEREGRDQYSLLTALVRRLGALELHLGRLSAFGDDGRRAAARLYDLRELSQPVPDGLHLYDAQASPAIRTALREFDSRFSKQCQSCITNTIRDLREHRDPHSDRWHEGLPVFFTGGGAQMSFYKEILGTISKNLQRAWRTEARGLHKSRPRYDPFPGLEIRSLPRPHQLTNDDLAESDYNRLGVATGLSFDALDIGKIVPPHDIDDIRIPELRSSWRDRFIDQP